MNANVSSALASSETLGLVTAAGLIALLALLLPRGARRQIRQPILFLALHLALRGLLVFAPEDPSAWRVVSFGALAFILAAIGRTTVLLVLDVVLGRRASRPLPQIARDITLGVVYAGVLLAALRAAGVEPGSILTTSALLTAAVALSLQETLGNMVAGLAIQVQRPFDVGDWIQFDGEQRHIGEVLEINWRATKVITLDAVEVVIPNATLAKAAITNFTKPTATSRRSLYVQVPADVPPLDVRRIVLDSLAGSFGLLPEPAPSVVTNAFVDGNVEYWIRFFTDRFDQRDAVDGSARDRIWYGLARAGVALAAPGRAVALTLPARPPADFPSKACAFGPLRCSVPRF
jgi:small-conductance mechanosensitive channel